MGRVPIALFFDQLNVHRSKDVKPWYEKLNIKPVFNVAYSPEYNPIEAIFSKVKAVYNHKRLNNLVNKVGFNSDREIELAFKAITVDHCAACVRKSLYLL
jgi:transposase